MGFISSIKMFFYRSTLNKHLALQKSFKRKNINLHQAKHIGIVYNATQVEHVVAVTKFIEYLKSQNKKVYSLAYLNTKQRNDDNFTNYYNNKHTTWYEIPRGKVIDNFQTKEIDILISALTSSCLSLEYIIATSKSTFRVGPYAKHKTGIYDFMINIDGHDNLDYYFKQVKNYLTQL